jgi:hypothetical protein
MLDPLLSFDKKLLHESLVSPEPRLQRLPHITWRFFLHSQRQSVLEGLPIPEHVFQEKVIGNIGGRFYVANGFKLPHVRLPQNQFEIFQAFVVTRHKVIPLLGGEVIGHALDGIIQWLEK